MTKKDQAVVLALPGKITETSWQLPANLSFDEWLEAGEKLKRAEKSLMWWIGDWLAFGEIKYGETWAQAADVTDKNIEVIRKAKWVAERVESGIRIPDLSWSHHREVASLDVDKQSRWLTLAADQKFSVRDLSSRISDWKRGIVREKQELDAKALGKFNAIYADPPWTFKVWPDEGKDRSAENHYPTMELEEIKALPVCGVAAKDCVLFLWAVMPRLPEAFEVIEAWGFEYKTCGFVWLKETKDSARRATGMGYWTRANAELVLLATKGSPQRLNADVHQVVTSPRMGHSRKPEEVAMRIERLVSGPCVELFARGKRPGWTVWGNEIGNAIEEK